MFGVYYSVFLCACGEIFFRISRQSYCWRPKSIPRLWTTVTFSYAWSNLFLLQSSGTECLLSFVHLWNSNNPWTYLIFYNGRRGKNVTSGCKNTLLILRSGSSHSVTKVWYQALLWKENALRTGLFLYILILFSFSKLWIIWPWLFTRWVFPGKSAGKESACNDMGLPMAQQ